MTPRVGLAYDPLFLKHETGNHPEQPDRLRSVVAHLKRVGLWEECAEIAPLPALDEDLLRVHAEALVHRVESTRGRGPGHLDADTVYSGQSAAAARLAAGAVMTAVRDVMAKKVDRALALVRPPGHHATPTRIMGFCLYNNVAVATRFLTAHYEISRMAIIDFDVHHGNGTQDAFFEDGDVFFFSIHQGNFYPGTGDHDECGAGPGLGTTLNIPFEAGTPRQQIMAGFRSGLEKVFEFRPQFVFISAGFDAHDEDPLGMLTLHSDDYFTMTRWIVEGARDVGAQGIVSTLEGGYNLRALAESVEHHLRALMTD